MNSTLTTNVNSSRDLNDINYLLFLETLKRFNYHQANIQRQLEKKEREHRIAKAQYKYLYEKYVSCVQLAATRSTLERNSVDQTKSCYEDAKANISSIIDKIGSSNVSVHVDEMELDDCKANLRLELNGVHDNLREVREYLNGETEAAANIRVDSHGVEKALEIATEQSLDYFVDALKNIEI